MTKKGKLIAIEGIEGTGKSTLAKQLAEYYTAEGEVVHLTREPGGDVVAEDIRSILKHDGHAIDAKSETLLMFASRALHVENVIKPALDRGEVVITDRYVDASYAYQGGGRGVDQSILQTLDNWVCGEISPDITILLDCPVEDGMQRVNQRVEGLDRIEKETVAFFERARARYLEVVQNRPVYCVIDASMPQSAVYEQAIEFLNAS